MAMAANPTSTFLDILATAIETAGASNLKVGLFTGSPTLGPDTVLSDLTEPTYTGYARQTVTIGTRRGNANGDIILPLDPLTFAPTADVSPAQTITGYFICQGASPALWLAELLDQPWTVTSALDFLTLILEILVSADPVYGGVCTVCSS